MTTAPNDAAVNAESAAKLVSEWVSVFERLPENPQRYFVEIVDGDDMCHTAIRMWDGTYWRKPNTIEATNELIAFWTPMPQTWMLTHGHSGESWTDYKIRLWNQLWPNTRKFTTNLIERHATPQTQADAQSDKDERAHLRTIDERDAALEALSQAYYLVTGRSPDWSSVWGINECLEEIDDAQQLLRASIPVQSEGAQATHGEGEANNAWDRRELGASMEHAHPAPSPTAAPALDVGSNYVADREVRFANGRIVRVVGDGYLEVERA